MTVFVYGTSGLTPIPPVPLLPPIHLDSEDFSLARGDEDTVVYIHQTQCRHEHRHTGQSEVQTWMREGYVWVCVTRYA